MAKQTININNPKPLVGVGTTANDKSGDPLRTAFNKLNAAVDKIDSNFTELYSSIGADVQIPIQTGNNGKYLTTNGTTSSWGAISGSTADPTEPSSPTDGLIWIDTDGTAPTTVVTRWSKTPTNGTTTLSGTDDTTNVLAYTPGYEQVFLNGVLLSRGSDYTATTGTSVVLTTGTVTSDIVEIIAALQVAYTDTITTAAAATTYVAKALTTTTGDIIYASAANTPARLGIGSSAQVLTVASGLPSWATPASGSGLTQIVGASFTASAGISVNSCFTSTYKRYKVVFRVKASTTAGTLTWRWRTSGTDLASGNTAHLPNISFNTSGFKS